MKRRFVSLLFVSVLFAFSAISCDSTKAAQESQSIAAQEAKQIKLEK